MISCITCTGNRTLAFELSQEWMKNQTLKPDEWIVVDDGNEVPKLTFPMKYIKRERQRNEPKFTMLLNLKEAVKHVNGDKIVIWEDDEYYAPNYLGVLCEKLDSYDLVGFGHSKYYHLPSGEYYQHGNEIHASLAQTAFNKCLFDKFKEQLDSDDNFVDMRLWKNTVEKNKKKVYFDNEESLYCGMKGMPGRIGIGAGHRHNVGWYIKDIDNKVLKQWIPKDYLEYLKIRESINFDLK